MGIVRSPLFYVRKVALSESGARVVLEAAVAQRIELYLEILEGRSIVNLGPLPGWRDLPIERFDIIDAEALRLYIRAVKVSDIGAWAEDLEADGWSRVDDEHDHPPS